ncbi:YhgE/Pip domain-containing protein [Leucobacter sp. UT-8R-CII-1-4]|uniref:YhgE/Pip domain-containing protein n=1 Tax=Leucobacter sp. UT-8R-CII-1-4 TaxID=3040075 RepID=UPI0024A99090|nr:YhgE/Pip domain-containing protein [Leucobacter sp. UT-8R-CII-1-4]MDI6021972.1 YhgE/Pip domain-containing protein [Leucobacter sp. UT-8R-CII-1-4]
MSDILHLIRRDLRHITRNVMASIVVFGLVIIPSLFTWFNVIASWDPFANTSNLKVAVASTDTGYQSDLMPIRVNVGEQVLSELRANDGLDWIITSKEDALDGTKSGKYYAAIVLPPSFSADMMTFYANGSERTSIDFYTNEKKNALAPKITEQGAEGVSAQINESFTRTLSDVGLTLLSSVSDYLTDADTQAALTRLEARVGSISDQLRSGAHTADTLTALVQGSVPLVDSTDALVRSARTAFSDTSNALGGGASAVKDLKSALGEASGALGTALQESANAYDAVGVKIDELFANGNEVGEAQAAVLDSLGDAVDQQIAGTAALRAAIEQETAGLTGPEKEAAIRVLARLDDSIARQEVVRDRLYESATAVRNGNAQAQQSHESIKAAIAEAKQAITDAKQAYVKDLQPQLDKLAAALEAVSADVQAIRGDLSSINSGLSGSGDSARAALTKSADVTQKIATSLNEAADKFTKLQSVLADAAGSGDLSKLSEAIGSDPGVLATSLAEPVRVDRTAVFPVAVFGAGMAPLYTILALWVGALLMTVTIRVDVNSETLPDREELSPTKKYFGRYGVFALVGLAQSTLLTLGLILFVQIEPAHPLLMVLAGWVISLVFTLIIYTFVVAFGNAGKALAVLLLVIQISGSGGAYPLQLLPPWFQGVSPFLPATYAIDAMRAAVAGVYRGDFWVAIGMLLLFIVPTLLLGLVLRRPMIPFNRKLMDALESTKLM